MNRATDLKGEQLVVLTAAEYRALIEDSGDAALARRAAAEDAGLPGLSGPVAVALGQGTLHPLTAWRQAHGLGISALAAKAGIRAATISDIEHRKIDPRLSTVRALAEALGLDIDDIV